MNIDLPSASLSLSPPQWWVWKFGGSSVANYQAFEQVCALVIEQFTSWADQQERLAKSYGTTSLTQSSVPGVAINHLTVVVSAIKGVTNQLESAVKCARDALEKLRHDPSPTRRNCFLVDARTSLNRFREAAPFVTQLEAARFSHYFGASLVRLAEVHMGILDSVRDGKRHLEADEFASSFFNDLVEVVCMLEGIASSGTHAVAQSSLVLGMGENWSVELLRLIIAPRIQAFNTAKRCSLTSNSRQLVSQPFVVTPSVLKTRHVLTLKETQKTADIRSKLKQQLSGSSSLNHMTSGSPYAGASKVSSCEHRQTRVCRGVAGCNASCTNSQSFRTGFTLRFPENESNSFLPGIARSKITNGDHTIQQWLSPQTTEGGTVLSSRPSDHVGPEKYSIGPQLISNSSREASHSPRSPPVYPISSAGTLLATACSRLDRLASGTVGGSDVKLSDSTNTLSETLPHAVPITGFPPSGGALLDRTPTRGVADGAAGDGSVSTETSAAENWAFPSLKGLGPNIFPPVGPPEYTHLVTGSIHRLPRLDWRVSYRNFGKWFGQQLRRQHQIGPGRRPSSSRRSSFGDSDLIRYPSKSHSASPLISNSNSCVQNQPHSSVGINAAGSSVPLNSTHQPPVAQLILATGFVCQTLDGQPATFQRNGSDTSAVILAALLRAEGVTIWSDVAGILTGDPRYCRNAQPIEFLSYEEALELAGIGARVLHPASLLPSIHMKLPMLLKSTFEPELPGTTIADYFHIADSANYGKVVTKISDVCLFTLSNFPLTSLQNFASRLFAATEKVGALPLFITQGLSCSAITTAVAGSEMDNVFNAIVEEFRHDSEDYGSHLRLAVDSECSILSVVGRGQRSYVGALAAWSTALSKRRVNVKAISQSSSELSTSFVVARSSEREAVDALHEVILGQWSLAAPLSVRSVSGQNESCFEHGGKSFLATSPAASPKNTAKDVSTDRLTVGDAIMKENYLSAAGATH